MITPYLISNFIRWVKWNIKGQPVVKYPGYNCGCCGHWNAIPFEIPTYQSHGEWWDTWGLCPEGKGCRNEK